MRPRPAATAGISLLLIAIGIVLVVRTAFLGGGAGYLLGALFVVAGTLRLYVSSR